MPGEGSGPALRHGQRPGDGRRSAYLADEPVLAGPPSVSYRLRKFVRRNRGPVLAATVLLLALVAGVVGTSWGLVEARRQRGVAEEQEQRTKEEAAIALAVNEFLLKDLLGQADISNQQQSGGEAGRNRNITVKELLDRAARAIEGKFADQPLTEAAVRLTLGDTYHALGHFEESEKHLSRSVQLRTAKLGADHPDTLTSKQSLADLYRHLAALFRDQGKSDRAETLLKEVLNARTARLGADHSDTLTSKNSLALLYDNQKKYDLAETLYKEVIDASTAKLGADHLDTLPSKNNLALVYKTQGKLDLAEPLFREVLQGVTAKLGADHPNTLTVKQNLAQLYLGQRKYDRAETLFKEVARRPHRHAGGRPPPHHFL